MRLAFAPFWPEVLNPVKLTNKTRWNDEVGELRVGDLERDDIANVVPLVGGCLIVSRPLQDRPVSACGLRSNIYECSVNGRR